MAATGLAVVALGLLARGAPPAAEPGEDALPVETAEADAVTPREGEPGDPRAGEPADGWRAVPTAPVAARSGHVLVWTGPCPADAAPPACGEALVWGGVGDRGPLADGAAYDPARDTWRRVPEAPRGASVPLPAAWTGDELVVWGGTAADRGRTGAANEPRGVAYDPAADRWRTLRLAPIAPRTGHTLTWTGAEVLVWGGRLAQPWEPPALVDTGARYDPGGDTWRVLPTAPIAPRTGHAALTVPDGRVVVFGGHDVDGTPLTDGGVYDPATNGWSVIQAPPIPVVAQLGGFEPALAWHEGALHVVAPLRERSRGDPLVGVYDLDAGRWSALAAGPVGLRSGAFAAGLHDGTLLVWGGRGVRGEPLTDGGVRLPDGSWEPLGPGPDHLTRATAVWTGRELFVWGGAGPAGLTARGAALSLDPERVRP